MKMWLKGATDKVYNGQNGRTNEGRERRRAERGDANRCFVSPPMTPHQLGPNGRYAAAQHYLGREFNTHYFHASHPPAISIKPGEMIQVQTFDCFKGKVDGLNAAEAALVDLKDEECNPVTGPIFVEGAEPGDTLSVTIHHIQPGPRGCAKTYVGAGQLHSQCPRPYAQLFSISDGVVTMSPRVSFPARPMLGVLGVAPAGSGAVLTMPAGAHGGNLDNNANGIGATVHIKVCHQGGLLSVGDMHASQGDGEVCGTGVEVGGDVLLSVALLKGVATEFPVTELSDVWITHGVADEDINRACKIACEEAAGLLVKQWMWTYEEAFVFLSVQGQLGICQNVHPSKGTVIAKMQVPKNTACPSPFNAARVAGRSEKDCLLYEALGHFVADDAEGYFFEPTSGGVNNVVYYVYRKKTAADEGRQLVGVLRVYNNGCDDLRVVFEHSVLGQLQGQKLSFSIPATISTLSGGAAFVKLSNGASACLFKAIAGGLPKLSKVREIGFCAGELSRAMSKIERGDVPKVCPTFPYHEVYKVHKAVTRELFYEQLQSSVFDPWRVYADEVESDLRIVEEKIGSLHGVLPWSVIHGDLHYDNVLADETGVTGLLDFEFSAYDWRAMELAICLSKYCSEAEPMAYFESFVDGFAVHGELEAAEIESICVLIRLRILSNVVYFVGRALAGEDQISTLTSRIETYCTRLRWLKNNEREIVALCKSKFEANGKCKK